MSIMEQRGGFPKIQRLTVTAEGGKFELRHTCKYLSMRVADAACRLYFTEADFTRNEHYIKVPIAAAATPYGEWQGPVETQNVWLKADSGTSQVELVTFERRG